MAAKIETVKKITIGTLECQPTHEMLAELEKKGPAHVIHLLDVYGIAAKFKPDHNNFGEFVSFIGQFRAVRARDKAGFQASKLILPKMLEDQLWAAMGGDEVANVQFAFRIGVKLDKKGAKGYSYTAESLMPPSENDPVSMLEKQLSGKLLPAPKAA